MICDPCRHEVSLADAEAEIRAAHRTLTELGVEVQIPPFKAACAPLVMRILRLDALRGQETLDAARSLRDAALRGPKP